MGNEKYVSLYSLKTRTIFSWGYLGNADNSIFAMYFHGYF